MNKCMPSEQAPSKYASGMDTMAEYVDFSENGELWKERKRMLGIVQSNENSGENACAQGDLVIE